MLHWKPNCRIAIAFDPARTVDNSITSVMNIYNDPELGICGDIVNCVNMVDTASKKKYKLDSNRQLLELRELVLSYNGGNADYEYIDCLMIDQGSGGGGVSTYADNLLNDWIDTSGRKHRGFIDASHEIYADYTDKYPNAVDKLRLLSPRKFRTQMVEEFIELINLGVIKFPFEYNGQDFVKIIDRKGDEEILSTYELNEEEMLALTQIDLMKTEITSIHKSTNPEKTSVTYALSKEKENKLHDDRFYTVIMLAHRLYELRRSQIVDSEEDEDDMFTSEACVSSVDF